MSKGTQRRLTTIVAADISGFSRLVGIDEEATLAAQRGHRSELIEPLLSEYHGRIANTAGDSFLFEFPSAVEAVRCSIAVQDGMAERNQNIPAERRIEYRIGINVGDVVADGDDLLGDGVNIAARLENICQPGGIILSDDAYRQVRDRVEIAWEDGGAHEVKNIARPVQIWRWRADAETGTAPTGEVPLALPDKPSIAVLPFDNMSGDPEQEYFSDGISEDIITALSKFRWFFVTARNSTFTYKGTATDIKQVGRELGVRYVLEGSVRKAGNRIRVTAQLIEAETGNHVWAERYDRNLDDIFELQDEIASTIAGAVEPELASSERDRVLYKPTSDLQAWDLFQRGLARFMDGDHGEDRVVEAMDLIRQATAIDPKFAAAYSRLAMFSYSLLAFRWTDSPKETLQRGIAYAKQALSLDRYDYFAHAALGRLHIFAGDPAAAIGELEAALRINPNVPQAHQGLAIVNNSTGNYEQALKNAEIALRLSPNDPATWQFELSRAWALIKTGRSEEAVEAIEKAIRHPSAQYVAFNFAIWIYVRTDQLDKAKSTMRTVCRMEPDLSIAKLVGLGLPISRVEQGDIIEALRTAGMPEE